MAAPHHFAEPTFIQSQGNGRVQVARLDDGTIVQVLAPASRSSVLRIALREPNGNLLVEGCELSCGKRPPDYLYAPYWRDATTGMSYPGDSAAVSPDGSRIATLVVEPNRREIIRQYDVSTGRVLSDLIAGVQSGYGSVLGFAWTPDSRSLVVAVAPRTGNTGGLYVADRTTHHLPSRPTVPNTLPPAPFSGPDAYASPAVLADGHVVAFQYSFPIQHEAWPGELIDIDLGTGTHRVLLGAKESDASPRRVCSGLPRNTVVTNATRQPCDLVADGAKLAAGGNDVLLSSDVAVWLYDGQSMRKIANVNPSTVATW